MLKILENAMSRLTHAAPPSDPPRCVRPSLLDLRFTGDPWVVDQEDGSVSVRLDNYPLAFVQVAPFDMPSLNRLFLELRQWQIRRHRSRQFRARRRQAALAKAACEAH